MSSSNHRFSIMLFAVAIAFFAMPASSIGQTLQINSIKANYLVGFLDFARWDGEIKSDHVVIGVVGSQELTNYLVRYAESKTKGRSLQILEVNPRMELPSLNILFVSEGFRDHWPTMIKNSESDGFLIVGEESGFVSSGGAIEFVLRKNRLQFRINAENAKRCGVELSSQLIELALE